MSTASLEARVERLESRMTRHDEDLPSVMSTVMATRDAVTALQRGQHVIRREVTGLKDDLHSLGVRVGMVRENVEVLQQDVLELKQDVGDLKTDVGHLKSDVGGLKTDVSGLKTDVSGLKTDVGWLKQAMGAVVTHLGVAVSEPGRPDA
jgi:chromosome segregation ATPase